LRILLTFRSVKLIRQANESGIASNLITLNLINIRKQITLIMINNYNILLKYLLTLNFVKLTRLPSESGKTLILFLLSLNNIRVNKVNVQHTFSIVIHV
jgi:hypothetical protein